MQTDGARPAAAPRFFSPRRPAGFTLVELVITLVIMATLTYLVVRVLSPKQTQALQQAERLRNDIRHVQALAMNLNKSLQVKQSGTVPGSCPANTIYWVIDCTVAAADPCTGAPNTPMTDPATGKVYCVAAEAGLGYSAADLQFDPLGRPRSGAALIPAAVTLTITGGNPNRDVVVTPVTGFVSGP